MERAAVTGVERAGASLGAGRAASEACGDKSVTWLLKVWGYYNVFWGLLISVASAWDCLCYCCSEALSGKS